MDDQRLTLKEVEECVAALSNEAIEVLALGPVKDFTPDEAAFWIGKERDCRACHALEPIIDKSPPAMALYNWHNLVSKPFELLNGLISDDTPLTEEGARLLHDELIELFGVLAYTRCLVIYSVAETEKLGREAAHKPATSVGGS
jgi:hypothetical protein